MDIQENQENSSFKEIFDILNVYISGFEAYSYYILYSLSKVSNNIYNTSVYQHLIILIFIALIIFILVVMYYDVIYREASKIKRCKEIEQAIEINDSLEHPYKYNVYIIKKSIVDKSLSNFSFCLQYDFVAKTTNVIFGEHKNLTDVIISLQDKPDNDGTLSSAFVYYDLSIDNYDYLEYTDIDTSIDEDNKGGSSRNTFGKTFYINKNAITDPKEYIFVITRYDNKVVGEDRQAYELLKFVKNAGFDKESVNLSAIYNILYSIDNKKNSIAI
jgi:hypothetical protein